MTVELQNGRIADLLKQRMGLDAAAVGHMTIERAIRLRMTHCGVQRAEDYWQRVSSSDQELQELIEAVVVPETWFFRDAESFAVLVQFVLREWLPARRTGMLRVLSIPCSSGEEPYSIAMALLEGGLPPARFEVVGMDISLRVLAHAKRAMFGKNSFRGQDLNFRERCFSLTADGYQLAQSIRERVRFQHGNVLTLDSRLNIQGSGIQCPSIQSYDVIFCRNMLIYLDESAQAMIIPKLDQLLTPQGILFTGPAEAFLMRGKGFVPIRHAGAFAFRKCSVQADEPPQSRMTVTKGQVPARPPRLAKPATKRAMPPTSSRTARKAVVIPSQIPVASSQIPVASSQIPAVPDKPLPDLKVAGQLADAGRLSEAAAMCEAYLREQRASTRAHYLLGLVRDALGQQHQAAGCYRKVLYLDPSHVEALMHLALLLETRGDTVGARRLRERARRVEEQATP